VGNRRQANKTVDLGFKGHLAYEQPIDSQTKNHYMNDQIEKRIEKFSREGSKARHQRVPLIAINPYKAERK
jgi:hypothetical protein